MNNKHFTLKEYLKDSGLIPAQNIIVHSSFKKTKSAFPKINPGEIINAIKDIITHSGSIIFSTFTYCFKKSTNDCETFDQANSKSKVGLLSETFRLSEGVIRTNSPTHSFALWGRIIKDIDDNNSPENPLGKDSVLEWLTNDPNSYVLMLGTDFSSLTYGHYLEIIAKVPWYHYSPWNYLSVLPIGVSVKGEQKLKEIPGCSKSFVNFEKYLLGKDLIKKNECERLSSYFISVKILYDEGMKFFSKHYDKILCPENTCPACDSRRRRFL